MNVSATAVTNAANLALFMVNLGYVLLRERHQQDPQCSVLDLKAEYRGYKYVLETIKLLPESPDEDLIAALFSQVARLGRIHPADVHVNAA
jgi:putative transposase